MKKIFLSILAVAIWGIITGIAYLYVAFPDVETAPDISVEGTRSQIVRGKYLAEHVAVCIDCHSQRDWSRFSGPILAGTYGKGGDVFNQQMGFPGTFYAKNITPHNLQEWTDGEIYRLITTGVTNEEDPIFPVMPYPSYGKMDPDDVKAIIAYLRTLEPIAYEAPESDPDFPVNLIMRTIPKPAEPLERPSPDDSMAYGKYLTIISGCGECHTPRQQGAPVDSMFLAGGFAFEMPFGTIRSANITPHRGTGLGNWSQEQFVRRFKQYDVPTDSLPEVESDQFNTVMPWQMYAGMKEQDLKAIYTYLQSLPAIEHKVTKFTPLPEQTGEISGNSGS